VLRSPRTSVLVCAVAILVATGAHARGGGDDPERQARRLELRQQLEAERERWRAEGPRRGPGGPVQGGFGQGGFGQGGHHDGPGPAPDGAMAPGSGASGGERPGWSSAPRLSPEERRALRRELREQRQ
jgi:hypothetical protein